MGLTAKAELCEANFIIWVTPSIKWNKSLNAVTLVFSLRSKFCGVDHTCWEVIVKKCDLTVRLVVLSMIWSWILLVVSNIKLNENQPIYNHKIRKFYLWKAYSGRLADYSFQLGPSRDSVLCFLHCQFQIVHIWEKLKN